MTLDEAIKHAEKVAKAKEREAKINRNHGGWAYDDEATKCSACAEEHRQLAEWLKELKKYKEKDTPKLVIYGSDGDSVRMMYDWAECPSCGFTLDESDTDWEAQYCPDCGQALKWEVEE